MIVKSTGYVKKLLVSERIGKVVIQDEVDNQEEQFLFWSKPPTVVSDRILHSMYLSQARQAIAQHLKVIIEHPQDSAEVRTLALEVSP